MASDLVTIVIVVTGAFAESLSGGSFTGTPLGAILSDHGATLSPSQFASRDDDGQVYLTFYVPDHSAEGFEGRMTGLDGVIAVYRKPGEELP